MPFSLTPEAFTPEEIARILTMFKRSHFDLDGRGRVYLRLAARVLDGAGYRTLDFADINVNENARMQGVFNDTLATIEAAARLLKRDCVYVESIVNPVLRPALERRGYRVCMGFHLGKATTLDMFKRLENSNQ